MIRKSYFNYIVLLSSIFIAACGSSGKTENKKVSISSSDNQYSSNSSKPAGLVDFIFPTAKANINGADKTRVVLRVNISSSQASDIFGVYIGDIALEKDGDFWVTGDQELQLENGVAEQVFPVSVETSNGTIEVDPLILSTHASGVAGSGTQVSATGLAFNKLNSDLYFSDSVNKNVQKYDSVSGERSIIYQQDSSAPTSLVLYWSFVVDSSNVIYLMADRAVLDSDTAAQKYVAELVTIDTVSNEVSVQSIASVNEKNELHSAKSIVADIDGSLPTDVQAGRASVYAIDFNSSSPLKRVITDEDSLAYGYSYSVEPQNVSELLNTIFSSAYGPSALVRNDNSLIISRESSDVNGVEAGSLIEIKFTEEDVFGEKTVSIVATAFASLVGDNGTKITKPSALAFNQDKTRLYIADNRRIWEMDITASGYQKPVRLVSSSSIIPSKLGDGPDLSSSITAIELHPEFNILYMASGDRGVMALDVSSGDRITVAK